MGKNKRPWQDVDYVLTSFGRSVYRAQNAYSRYGEAGLEQGRRDELTGGGLIRSLGGWAEVNKLRLTGQAHMMSGERILGESAFGDSVPSQANETYERRYELKPQGYDVDRIAKRVAEIYRMEKHEVFSQGRQQRKVKARSLLCFWAVREIGMSLRELAGQLEMSAPGVGFAVERGEAIAHRNGYKLIE
jgi:putative transposase